MKKYREWGRVYLVALTIVGLSTGVQAGEEMEEWDTDGTYGYMGVFVDGVPLIVSKQLGLDTGVGVVVVDLAPDGPAEAAGLKKHDILMKYDDQILIGTKQIVVLVRNSEIGSEHTVSYLRGGKEETAILVVGETKIKKKEKVKDEHGLVLPVAPRAPIPPMPEMSSTHAELRRANEEIAKANAEVQRALHQLNSEHRNVLFFSGDDESDMERREEFEILIERVSDAVGDVDGVDRPTIVFQSQDQILEFTDANGRQFLIADKSGDRSLTIIDEDGNETYSGELNEEAKNKLPEGIRKKLPNIRRIVSTVPSVPSVEADRSSSPEAF